jgi:hypothetical protein
MWLTNTSSSTSYCFSAINKFEILNSDAIHVMHNVDENMKYMSHYETYIICHLFGSLLVILGCPF